ncbi:MAG TPA: RNA polymerase factor sigma-54, partial [Ramlibacter sp.]|nr:RNA polymerase factor sigma-54 [Ramlibacter sp.]
MKQGLSLRVSQHLALTPQLQQSIRLLQLSTLELSQEVEQMLGDNPFLELTAEEAAREEFGLTRADAPAHTEGDGEGDYSAADFPAVDLPPAGESMASVASATSESDSSASSDDGPSDWEGDGTTEVVPDDGEWGGDAPARRNDASGDSDTLDASELARGGESLQATL